MYCLAPFWTNAITVLIFHHGNIVIFVFYSIIYALVPLYVCVKKTTHSFQKTSSWVVIVLTLRNKCKCPNELSKIDSISNWIITEMLKQGTTITSMSDTTITETWPREYRINNVSRFEVQEHLQTINLN